MIDIKELAEQAGLGTTSNGAWYPMPIGLIHMVRFAELVAAAEREACAKVCDEHLLLGNKCAAAIRARGDKHD